MIKSHDNELIKTDLALKIPDGFYGGLLPIQVLLLQHSIDIGAAC